MFRVGDKVVYGKNGVCVIEDMQRLALVNDSDDKLYFLLKPVGTSGLTIYVPPDNELLMARMRRLMTRAEAETLLFEARGQSMPWISDRRERAEKFREIIAAGLRAELLLMIRSLHERQKELMSRGSRLNASDESALKSAARLAEGEFAAALSVETDKVGEYIRRGLEGEDVVNG